MHTKRFLVAAWTILLLAFAPIFGQNIFPESYSFTQDFPGSRLVRSATHSFLCKQKPYWIEQSEVLSSWRNDAPNHIQSVSLGSASVEHALIFSDSLLLAVLRQKNEWKLAIISPSGSLCFETPFVINAEQDVSVYLDSIPNTQKALLHIGGTLFLCSFSSSSCSLQTIAESNVLSAYVFPAAHAKNSAFAYLVSEGIAQTLIFASSGGNALHFVALSAQQGAYLKPCGTDFVLLALPLGMSTLAVAVRNDGAQVRSVIAAKSECISAWQKDSSTVVLGFPEAQSADILWRSVEMSVKNLGVKNLPDIPLPAGFWNPIASLPLEKGAGILFQNGFVSLDDEKKVLSADYFTIDAHEIPEKIGIKPDLMTWAGAKHSALFRRSYFPLWQFNRFVKNWWYYAFLSASLFVFLALYRSNRRQAWLLKALFEMENSDAVLVLDKQGRLIRLNEQARKILQLTQSAPLGRILHFYCVGIRAEELEKLGLAAIQSRLRIQQKISFQLHDGEHEFLISASPVERFWGRNAGAIIVGRDITEELEKKRLSNWAQLAHDMQTNLTIIRLNAEKISEKAPNEFSSVGKKIYFQSTLLLNRIRDLVALGRGDGALQTAQVDTEELCYAVKEEFDESLFPYVQIFVHCESFLLVCDKQKVIRALRNAVENAVRALQGKSGKVEISCRKSGQVAIFSVKDSGVGMDEDTQANMMKPFFSTFTKQGGTGMGTMIMRYVVQQHAGELFIHSEKGKGTTVEFHLPGVL